jgi:hypothetical protein
MQGWLFALLVPALSTYAAGIARWLAERHRRQSISTRIVVHDSDGHEVVLELDGRNADDVADAVQHALRPSSGAEPTAGPSA